MRMEVKQMRKLLVLMCVLVLVLSLFAGTALAGERALGGQSGIVEGEIDGTAGPDGASGYGYIELCDETLFEIEEGTETP